MGPEVTLSTWDAIARVGPKGYMSYPTVRTETPSFGKASGAAWPCLFNLMVSYLSVNYASYIIAYVMFYLGFLAGLRLTGAPCGR